MDTSAQAEWGSLYAAVGEKFVRKAERSARSLRQVMPAIRLALASDCPTSGPFDRTLAIPGGDAYRAKILAMRDSPFDRTLFLDADTYVVAELSGVFRLLDRFDFALAHAPNRVTMVLEDVPDSYPEFNTGVIAFRRTPPVQAALDAWLDEYDRLLPLEPPSKDQPSFRRVAFRMPELRIATLTPEFNQRFSMAGYINQPVRILHGEGDESAYREIAEAMNRPMTFREHRVFAGRKLFDDHGEQIADYRKGRPATGGSPGPTSSANQVDSSATTRRRRLWSAAASGLRPWLRSGLDV